MFDGFIKKVFSVLSVRILKRLHMNLKKQTIDNSCKTCSYRDILDTHCKLCILILKNPPENSNSSTGKKKKRKIERAELKKMAPYPAVRDHPHHFQMKYLSTHTYALEEEEGNWEGEVQLKELRVKDE